MNDVVQPVTVDPYVTQDSIRFSKLVVDIVQGKDTLYHVMYIGTGKSMRASNSSSYLLVYLAALGAPLWSPYTVFIQYDFGTKLHGSCLPE